MKLIATGKSAIRVNGKKLQAGERFEATEADAQRLIANGYAEPIDNPKRRKGKA